MTVRKAGERPAPCFISAKWSNQCRRNCKQFTNPAGARQDVDLASGFLLLRIMNIKDEINNLRFSICYEGKEWEWAKCQVPAKWRFSVSGLKGLRAAETKNRSH